MKKTLLTLVALIVAVTASAGIDLTLRKNHPNGKRVQDYRKERAGLVERVGMKCPASRTRRLPALAADYLIHAEGDPVRYASYGYTYAWGMFVFDSGLRNDLIFSADGQTVYITDIVPGSQRAGTYTQGTLGTNDQGQRTLTIKANQLVGGFETFEEMVWAEMEMTLEEYLDYIHANYEDTEDITLENLAEASGWEGPIRTYFVPALANPAYDEESDEAPFVYLDEYVLVEREEVGGFVSASDEPVYLFEWMFDTDEEGNEEGGFLNAAANVGFLKVNAEPCLVPEDVEYRSYVHFFGGYYSEEFARTEVGFKGDKIYLPGLVPAMPDAYAEGTLSADGVITLTPNQLMMSDVMGYYMTLVGLDAEAAIEYDEETGEENLYFNEQYDHIQLVYDAESGTIAPKDNMQIMNVRCGTEDWYDLTTHKYIYDSGDYKPAVPAAPREIEYYEVQGMFDFYLPYEDVDGNFINPDFLSYEVFLDGDDSEPYVFTTDTYVMLDEDMTVIPATFTDDWDFVTMAGAAGFYFYELWESIGIRARYEVDGVVNYSPIVWFTYDEADPSDGLTPAVAQQKSAVTYNLSGQQVGRNYRGMVIREGRKLVVK